MTIQKYVDLIGYVGLTITIIAAILFLLKLFGFIHSPTFENIVGTFIVGQSFYNGYLMAALKTVFLQWISNGCPKISYTYLE